MDLEALRARLRALVTEMRGLHTPPEDVPDTERASWQPDEAALARFEQLDTEATELRTQIEAYEARLAAIAAAAGAAVGGDDAPGNRGALDPPNINRGHDPYDLDTVRLETPGSDLLDRVRAGLDADSITPAEVKESTVAVLRSLPGAHRRSATMRCLATGSRHYGEAFAKMVSGRQGEWTDDERRAIQRAQSLVDAAGGFAVPYTLDPTIIGTDGLSINPIRRISRVVRTTTDSWNGVTGGAATWSWDAEAAQVSDDSITLAEPSIPVYKAQGFIPFSVEIEGDWGSIDSDLRTAMMEGKDNLEAQAHIKGTGTGQPTGIETALDGTASEIAPATAEAFALADVYELKRLLPPRHRQAGPVWVMNVGTAGDINQFDTQGGGTFWSDLGEGQGERLLMWAWEEASYVDDSPDINAAATEQNFILFVGNWSRYVLVDRVGMSVEFVPHLFHTADNRPSGQRGLYAWYRHGADSVDDNAFRVLSIPTAA
jgi:HK97 family phage major capsid protein